MIRSPFENVNLCELHDAPWMCGNKSSCWYRVGPRNSENSGQKSPIFNCRKATLSGSRGSNGSASQDRPAAQKKLDALGSMLIRVFLSGAKVAIWWCLASQIGCQKSQIRWVSCDSFQAMSKSELSVGSCCRNAQFSEPRSIDADLVEVDSHHRAQLQL
jgi:hypothetical protein